MHVTCLQQNQQSAPVWAPWVFALYSTCSKQIPIISCRCPSLLSHPSPHHTHSPAPRHGFDQRHITTLKRLRRAVRVVKLLRDAPALQPLGERITRCACELLHRLVDDEVELDVENRLSRRLRSLAEGARIPARGRGRGREGERVNRERET